MDDPRTRMEGWRGRFLGILGVGDPLRSDDGFGVRLVERLRRQRSPEIPLLIDAGTCPERYVGLAVEAGCQDLVLADAMDFGAAPGTVLLARPGELGEVPVRASPHRVPLPLLAAYAEGLGARAWVLGVQPAVLGVGDRLSPSVSGALEAVAELLARALGEAEGGKARQAGPGLGGAGGAGGRP